MRKCPSPFVLVVMLVLALAMLSCGAPVRSTPNQGQEASTEGGGMQSDSAATSVRVSCIDVGKGDCILVQAGASSVLIDAGYKDTAGTVLSCLRNQGVDKLDALILTHYDKDHVSGLRPIAKAMPIDVIYLPGYEGADKNYDATVTTVEDLGLSARRTREQVELSLAEAQLVIHPSDVPYVSDANGDEGNDNDLSLVVTLTCGDDSYLFAGDLEEEGIEAFLHDGHGNFDVLKMPHHGEKSAHTDELIDAVQPKIALITDSGDDPADKKVLKLLKKEDVETYRTSTDGTIVVESDGSGSYAVTTGGQ